MSITYPIRTVRIVAPAHRAADAVSPADTLPGDVIEFTDTPVRVVDPVTRTATERLQRFRVGHDGALAIVRS